jgi:hypothetical protein
MKLFENTPRPVKKGTGMKKIFFALMAASFMGACSNPALKWIDTPAEAKTSSGEEGRIAGQPAGKEIVSFTFGLGPDVENDLPIGKSPDHTGKFPIKVILSNLPGTASIGSLRPTITFIGKSLSPGSGIPGDFSSPVDYRVTAEDGSYRDYTVTVYVKTSASKEIVRFDLDLGSGLAAEGIIDQNAGTITATVPAGTNLNSLTAYVGHTGRIVRDPQGVFHSPVSFEYTGNFSAPTEWTVIDLEDQSKIYTVTVNREKSDVREITRFNLGITGEEEIIGGEPQPDGKYPILAIVPSTASLTARVPFIDYEGVSISPAEGGVQNFSNPLIPVTYTVAAENGSTRDYVVKVITKDVSPASTPEITGFYFKDPLVEGVIDQNALTIALTVPAGTSLNALVPEIYYRGGSVSPKSGQQNNFTGSETNPVSYTVWSADGSSTKTYQVTVFVQPPPPTVDVPGTSGEEVNIGSDGNGNYTVIVELPTYIYQPVININYPGSSGPIIINNSTGDLIYNTTVGVNNEYTVVVLIPPSGGTAVPDDQASIDGFYFDDPAAIGVIGTGAGTEAAPIPITVTVPYGTALQNLKATIFYTGQGIVGLPGPSPLKQTRGFSSPVKYTVTAKDGTTTKTYEVTVTRKKSNAKDISAFSFSGVSNTSAVISAQPTAAGKYPIVVTVPSSTSLSSLTPVITYTGDSIAGPDAWSNTAGPGTVTAAAKNFSTSDTAPVEYTVTAQDSSTKIYAVTVREAESTDEDIEITGFYFTEPLAVGKINDGANLITVTAPSGTGLGSLTPSVYFTGMTLSPPSGTANNFTGPAAYTITGVTGKTRTYTVVVNPTPSGSKDITRFKLSGVVNTNLIIGGVPDPDGTYPISVEVPSGTDITNLRAEITHTGVSVSPEGESPGNFSNPRTYTVTAEDGTAKFYKVTVHAGNSGAIITSFIFDQVPLSGGESVRVVASIDQNGKTISAAVPSTALISSLQPAITYIGKSITGPGGESTANPFTESTGRNFTGLVTYTVKAQNDTTVPYTVTVTKQSAFTVTFEGEADIQFITNTFDPATGIVTVTGDTSKVPLPYDWYIDGTKQVVSGNTLTLNIGNGSFYPGRYEIMVSGMKDGLHYTGKVYFVVSGGA